MNVNGSNGATAQARRRRPERFPVIVPATMRGDGLIMLVDEGRENATAEEQAQKAEYHRLPCHLRPCRRD